MHRRSNAAELSPRALDPRPGMETRDWSLVVFTVLTQAAVGAFLVLQVLEYLAARRAAPSGAGHPEDPNAEAGGGRAADGPRNGPAADGPRNNGPARAATQDDEPDAGNAQESGRATAGAAHAGRRTPAPLLVVLVVLSAGLFAALFHLSDPLQAARAVVNFLVVVAEPGDRLREPVRGAVGRARVE